MTSPTTVPTPTTVWLTRCAPDTPVGVRHRQRALVRAVLAAVLGRPDPDAVETTTLPGGKPVLVAGEVDGRALHFSVAHSGPRLVVVTSTDGPVGVDVERHRPVPVDVLAPRVLSAAERDRFAAVPAGRRPAALLQVWTRKEALLKASGEGLSRPLDGLEVELGTPDAPRPLTHTAGPPWQLYDVSPDAGLVVAVATSRPASVQLRTFVAQAGPGTPTGPVR